MWRWSNWRRWQVNTAHAWTPRTSLVHIPKETYNGNRLTRSLATVSGNTPLAKQYRQRKKEYPDCMLLFQVGDFFEFFGDDATKASRLLGLALAKRTKQSEDSKMCGFPVSSLNTHVEKLVMHHGLKVAICEQVEAASVARKRGNASIVDRQVVRVVTPGSLVEDNMLTPEENNNLAALFPPTGASSTESEQTWGLAWADLSTGEFVSTIATTDRLASAIARCAPKEILLPSTFQHADADDSSMTPVKELLETALPSECMRTYRPLETFDGSKARDRYVREGSFISSLHKTEQHAIGAVVDYVDFTQQQKRVLARPPQHVESSDNMLIDSSAWKALELSKSLAGSKASSLLAAIDATITPGGSRLLASHLAAPLLNLDKLNDRLDAVTYFFEQERLLQSTRKHLEDIFDMERSLQRLSVSAGTPRDLKNISMTILQAGNLASFLENHRKRSEKTVGTGVDMPSIIQECCARLKGSGVDDASDENRIAAVAQEIQAAVKDDMTGLNNRRGFVATGYSEELDQWRELVYTDARSATSVRTELQEKYRKLLKSNRLRVIFQAEKGFFLEIPHEEHNRLIQTPEWSVMNEALPFRSLKNAVRYRPEDLRQLNRNVLEASQEVERLEDEIFLKLRQEVLSLLEPLQAMARQLSYLDVLTSHAHTALQQNFSRPELDTSRELHIDQGRHAVVESAHLRGKNSNIIRAFVPNDLHLIANGMDEIQTDSLQSGGCMLLTGPNMGGKSTFLRQNAHLVVLAQIGSYVPANFARVGLVDKLFCRVGSADELAADRSTFMVEMQETATILTQATPRSFVVMDEVGRGTAVDDGLAIAAAVLENLSRKNVRTLFASHFKSLDKVVDEDVRKQVQLHRMEVLERNKSEGKNDAMTTQLIFSHRVVPGLATKSYGVHTAALAGCPTPVIERASELLSEIKSSHHENDYSE